MNLKMYKILFIHLMKLEIGLYYLGIVFVIASIHRFFLKKDRMEEMERLHLPKYFDIIIYSFEMIIGLILLSNLPFYVKRIGLILLLIFLLIGCFLTLLYRYKDIIKTYTEVFTFQPTCMSYCMHLAYIVIILTLIF